MAYHVRGVSFVSGMCMCIRMSEYTYTYTYLQEGTYKIQNDWFTCEFKSKATERTFWLSYAQGLRSVPVTVFIPVTVCVCVSVSVSFLVSVSDSGRS